MWTLLTLLLLAPAPAGPDPLQPIELESRTVAFNSDWDVSVVDGRIYLRRRLVAGEPPDAWRLLRGSGLPAPSDKDAELSPPRSIVEISADGDNLVAVGDTGRVFYMKFGDFQWTASWGVNWFGARRGRGLFGDALFLPPNRGWDISHRGPIAGGYGDIDGSFHPIDTGVTTLYLLAPDGYSIRYADPWLPTDFEREICGPMRGRFIADSMSAAASSLFLINRSGVMYTRLADYDTVGDNPFLGYSYERTTVARGDRTLPPEDWRRQPDIDGRITGHITILQTGRGNGGRQLRVEGLGSEGQGGTWRKPVLADAWTFVPGTGTVVGPFLDDGTNDALEALGPDREQTWSGELTYRPLFSRVRVRAELHNVHPVCSPATLRLTVDGQTVELPLHLRRRRPDTDPPRAIGTLIIPPEARELTRPFFRGASTVDVVVRWRGDEMTLQPGTLLRTKRWFTARFRRAD